MVPIIWLAVVVLTIVGMWKVFTKAGQPGWAAIIPIYNWYVLLQIAGKPTWWLILILLVPVANLVCAILALLAVAERFGKGAGFAVGLVFLAPIFFPILGLGSAQYVGAAAAPPVSAPPVQTPPTG
ncbi:MAG TPA: DUF5684 domain-containing protein [Phycisphaerae bacterium]|nr:DUF5684 domain-containing protein [Phycisphaerae bacterium]HUU60756.1 DUF5684 domain-containing protein [Phycisphaerae bacterium]